LTFSVIAVYLIVLVGSVLVARRNLRQGRGDRRGAARVAVFYFIVQMLVWLFAEHHNGQLAVEFGLFFRHLARAVFNSAFLWVLYVALEPFIRRRWPQRIISWSRLLAGSYRDPLVGRDVLIGAVFGAAMIVCTLLQFVGLRWIGRPPELSLNPGDTDIGAHLLVARFAAQVSAGLFLAFFTVFMLLLFFVLLRRERLALIALWLLITLLSTLVTQTNALMVPFVASYSVLLVFVLYRYGLLALALAFFVSHLWVFFPITSDFAAWYAFDFVIALAISVALAAYGFHMSLAGQSLFGGKLLDD